MRRVKTSWSLLLLVAASMLLSTVAPRIASAAWPEFGRAITTAPNNQSDSRTASDGAGGAIVVWVDAGSGAVDLLAQHVLASGDLDPAWPSNGRPLLTDPASLPALGTQGFPVIVSDGAGGAIVAWRDGRTNLTTGADVYAQHVLASGQVDARWPANGVPLCTALGPQNQLAIISDGAGGAIVAWMDSRSAATQADIFAQHVLASGIADTNWKANGVAVCTAPGRQVFPGLDTDGSGGAIITWSDPRSTVTAFDIYAQHVSSTGDVDLEWPENGRAVCTAPGGQIESAIVSDGAHGAIVAWSDQRGATVHIFAHHVLGSGALDRAWPVDGLLVCGAPIEQEHAILVSDDVGGAIVAWEDRRSGIPNMFAQHVQVSGAVDGRWPVDGIALSTRPVEQSGGAIVRDGAGGAIVAWADGFVDVFAQHVLAEGALDPAFPVDGLPVIALPSAETSPSLVAAGAPGAGGLGAIVTWTDFRADSTSDIYALQLLTLITTGTGERESARGASFAAPSPNPARESIALRFRLPREAGVGLAIYDPAGRRVRQLATGMHAAGEHTIRWDLRDEAGRAVRAGLYLARLEAEGRVLTRKVAALR